MDGGGPCPRRRRRRTDGCDRAPAWARLRAEHPSAWLVLAGAEERRDPVPDEVLAALTADERVRFLGFVDDISAVYAAADVVVLPSLREGLPLVLLEAAAMQRPVVATQISGCTEVVRDGETGLLVEPRAAEPLYEAMARYAVEPALRREHGRAARGHIVERFAQADVWSDLLTFYRRATSAPA